MFFFLDFENSALKASFSLSSLQPSTGLEGVEHAGGRGIKNERLYNSLTKKRKEPKQDNSWRRSWGSSCDNKDDFWSALQANYDYIMDNNLIDSCQVGLIKLFCDIKKEFYIIGVESYVGITKYGRCGSSSLYGRGDLGTF